MLGERLALERGVERGELAQRLDRRARDVRQRGQAGLLAVGLDRGHVGLDDRRARRRRLERLDHSPADRLAHARERCLPAAGRGEPELGAGLPSATSRLRGAAGSSGPVRATRCASAAPRRRAAVLEVREHVRLAHAPAAAGALDLLEVDAVLGGDPHHHGRVAAGRTARRGRPRWAVPARRRVARRRGLAGRLQRDLRLDVPCRRSRTRGPRPACVGRDPREHRADLDGRADLDQHLLTRPLAGASTSVSILSVEIEAMISSPLHPVAGLLLPLHDGALGDRDAHLGHRDIHESGLRSQYVVLCRCLGSVPVLLRPLSWM